MQEKSSPNPSRRWTRRLTTALFLLFLGTIVNVAVAYLCFVAAEVHPAYGSEVPLGEVDWVHSMLPTIPDGAIVKQQSGVGFQVTEYLIPREDETASSYVCMFLASRVEIGLPLTCIHAHVV